MTLKLIYLPIQYFVIYVQVIAILYKPLVEKFSTQKTYAWARWAFASRPHEHRSPMLIYVCCVWHVIKCLNTEFIGSTNTINICLILSTIYIFIPVSGCVGRVSKHCFARVYGAVKTALDLWLYKQSIYKLLARVIRMSCVI